MNNFSFSTRYLLLITVLNLSTSTIIFIQSKDYGTKFGLENNGLGGITQFFETNYSKQNAL